MMSQCGEIGVAKGAPTAIRRRISVAAVPDAGQLELRLTANCRHRWNRLACRPIGRHPGRPRDRRRRDLGRRCRWRSSRRGSRSWCWRDGNGLGNNRRCRGRWRRGDDRDDNHRRRSFGLGRVDRRRRARLRARRRSGECLWLACTSPTRRVRRHRDGNWRQRRVGQRRRCRRGDVNGERRTRRDAGFSGDSMQARRRTEPEPRHTSNGRERIRSGNQAGTCCKCRHFGDVAIHIR